MIVLKILAASFVVALTLLPLVLFIGSQTLGDELISSYECDHMSADAEFLLYKIKYKVAQLIEINLHKLGIATCGFGPKGVSYRQIVTYKGVIYGYFPQ